MAVEQYANLAQDTLNGGINSGVTSLTLNDASEFPSTGNFRILIDTEILLCTARSGNNLTVTRGAESTVAASHSSGATVTLVATAGSIVAVGSAIHRRDTYANRPAAGTEGRLFLPSNAPTIDRDSGSLWTPHGPVFPLVEPIDGDFAWVNQETATVDTTRGGIFLNAPAVAGTDLRLRVKTAPSTPYSVTIGFIPFVPPVLGIFPGVGLVFRESSTGKLVTMGMALENDPDTRPINRFTMQKWSDPNTFSANYTPLTWIDVPTWQVSSLMFIRGTDNGTNLLFEISQDGVHFSQIFSVSRTDFLAGGANQVGIWAHANQSTTDIGIWLLHWSEA